ncbi:A/G-specific adenine glycosylase [Roseivirga sp. BDSF3-8]|uniref:A/G-specific adenine glycosylase n=1 Tax=Roseivirga sp. BDSF3-8 TaxID=3241598 RepID=UPI0035327975
MENEDLITKLLSWYHVFKRDLPWRKTSDPYEIWLSEIILQQTRVAQGLPYFERFIEAYPKIEDLANAAQEDVLRHWQGLGYYSRARNLHACAQFIVQELRGNFPKTYKELLKLPGVGPYTAAAIASFAYNEKVPAIDGNVMRVLSRLFGIRSDVKVPKNQRTYFELGLSIMPADRAGVFNQAMMEFGALHCTPANPGCRECPVQSGCFAFEHNLQGELPVRSKAKKVKNRYFNYIVFFQDENLYLNARGPNDIWQGLYDFYLVETKEAGTPELIEKDPVVRHVMNKGGILESVSATRKHLLSHQRIQATFFVIELKEEHLSKTLFNAGLQEFSKEKVEKLPKPVLIDNFLKDLTVC